MSTDLSAISEARLHDSVLIGVEMQAEESLWLTFRRTDQSKVTLAFRGESRPELLASGVVVPAIISRSCFHQSRSELLACRDYLEDSIADQLIARHEMYFPKGGWALVFEVSYGDPFAVFGFGDLIVEVSVSPESA